LPPPHGQDQSPAHLPPPQNPSVPASPSPSSPPSQRTRSKTKQKTPDSDSEEGIRGRLYPLREVPLGGNNRGIGFVAVPLSTGDVRTFKKEMGKLLDDPLGAAERLDQFLGPNT